MEDPLLKTDPLFDTTCLLAAKVWGKESQLICTMGEAGELIAAIGRYFQGRDPIMVNTAEEAADCVIMAMQIRQIVGVEMFDEMLRRKFAKFYSKLDDHVFAESQKSLGNIIAEIKGLKNE